MASARVAHLRFFMPPCVHVPKRTSMHFASNRLSTIASVWTFLSTSLLANEAFVNIYWGLALPDRSYYFV